MVRASHCHQTVTNFFFTHLLYIKESSPIFLKAFLPRSNNFKEIPLNQLEEIEWKINNTPRKCLKCQTPLGA
jgi:IS30 family transposase